MSGKAYEIPMGRITVNPGEDFKNKRYTFIALNATGEAVTPVAGKAAIGVIQEPNNVNEPAQAMIYGISFIQIGAELKPNDLVAVGADGKAIPVAAEAEAVGICMIGGAEGTIGSVLLK